MRRAIAILLLFGSAACVQRQARSSSSHGDDCGDPLHDASSGFVSIVFVNARSDHPTLWRQFGERIEGDRHYAVVDDRGFLGTVRPVGMLRCQLMCLECCREPEWMGRWSEPLEREAEGGLVLGFGPVDGRFGSARRRLPEAPDLFDSPWAWLRADSTEWRTVLQFDFVGDPSTLEVRRRKCAKGDVVTEARVLERGNWRLVSRTIQRSDRGGD